jgi:hypothetical protein
MASDRGTIARGAMTDQQSAWAEPTAPAGRRMPSAPRERRPALAFLAVLLVALGGGAAGLLVMKAGHKVAAIEITQPLGQGQQIPLGAMREVQISADSGINYVSWADAAAVAKVFAAVSIPAGTLLTPRMTVASNNLITNDAQVGLSLKAGQAPASLQIGDKVQAFAVGTGGGCGTTSGQSLGTGTITNVSGSVTSGGGTQVVTLAVPTGGQDAGQLACEANSGNVALVLTPGSGAG